MLNMSSEDVVKAIESEGIASTLSCVGHNDRKQWIATIMIGDKVWATIKNDSRRIAYMEAQHRLQALLDATYPLPDQSPNAYYMIPDGEV